MTRARLAVLVGLMGIAAPPAARADNPHLRAARAHKLALDYQAARASLRLAYEAGTNGPAELAEIFRLGGEVEAGLGDPTAAAWAFERLLFLVPDAALPPGTSPKLAAPFAAARERTAGREPLTIHHELVPGFGVKVVVDADRLALVVGAAVRYRRAAGDEPVVLGAAAETIDRPGSRAHGAESGWGQLVEARGNREIALPLPPADRLHLVLWVFDRYGNRLAVIGDEDQPVVVAGGGAPAAPAPRAPALYARWYPWAGLAVATAAAATYFGLEVGAAERDLDALHEDSSAHDFAEAAAIAQRGRRDAWLANIGFAVAGAAAVTSAVLWLRDPRRRRSGERRPAPTVVFGPALTAGGAGGFVAFGF